MYKNLNKVKHAVKLKSEEWKRVKFSKSEVKHAVSRQARGLNMSKETVVNSKTTSMNSF